MIANWYLYTLYIYKVKTLWTIDIDNSVKEREDQEGLQSEKENN